MDLILKKFPIQENIKWNKHQANVNEHIQEQPFGEFIKRLQTAIKSWEMLAAVGIRLL